MHQMYVTAPQDMWVMAVRQVSYNTFDRPYSQGLNLLLSFFSCVCSRVSKWR